MKSDNLYRVARYAFIIYLFESFIYGLNNWVGRLALLFAAITFILILVLRG